MKRSFLSLLLLATSTCMATAHSSLAIVEAPAVTLSADTDAAYEHASIKFRNQSNYTMTLKIVYTGGRGHYTTIVLNPHTSREVAFSSTDTFRIKIKAKSSTGRASYHDGGIFSVTCNAYEHSMGEMTFQMASYGDGLGPSISAEAFESNR